jgi:hypothetical protein
LRFRTDGTGKTIGGGLISRGHLYKILSKPIYPGRLTHKGQAHDGLHDPIVDQETWDRVQLFLAEHAQRTAGNSQSSDALLAGKLFDDRGNRMSPSHATKGGRRWRYYVSQAVLQGRKHEVGSVARVPALEIERRVAEAVRAASSASKRQGWQELHHPKARGHGASTDVPAVPPTDYAVTLRPAIERVVMSRTTIEIELAEGMASDDQNRILIIPWTPPSSRCATLKTSAAAGLPAGSRLRRPTIGRVRFGCSGWPPISWKTSSKRSRTALTIPSRSRRYEHSVGDRHRQPGRHGDHDRGRRVDRRLRHALPQRWATGRRAVNAPLLAGLDTRSVLIEEQTAKQAEPGNA